MSDFLNTITIDGVTYNLKDNTIPDWARAEAKPTYTADEVDAVSATDGGTFEKTINVGVTSGESTRYSSIYSSGMYMYYNNTNSGVYGEKCAGMYIQDATAFTSLAIAVRQPNATTGMSNWVKMRILSTGDIIMPGAYGSTLPTGRYSG